MLEFGLPEVLVGGIANADDQSPLLWGGIMALLIVGAMALGLYPFLRVGIALAAVIVLMVVYKIVRREP